MAAIRKRVLKNGKSSFEVRIHRADHPDLSKSFPTMEKARTWANATETKIDIGGTVNRKGEKVLVSTALSDFLASGLLGPSEELRLRVVSHDLGEYSVAALTHKIVGKYVAQLLITPVPPPAKRKKAHPLYNGGSGKLYAPSSVRKFFYLLKKGIEWHARTEGYYIDPQVFKDQEIPEPWSGARERRLATGEENKLYEAAARGYAHQEEWPLLIGLALETALRAQEQLLARWQDLNLPGRTLNIPEEHVKTGNKRQIPLSSRACEILVEMERRKKADNNRIFWQFPDNGQDLAKAFKRLTHRAGILDLRWHDLRHEATSRLFEKGKLSDMQISKVTGHSSLDTLSRYYHLRPSELANMMD